MPARRISIKPLECDSGVELKFSYPKVDIPPIIIRNVTENSLHESVLPKIYRTIRLRCTMAHHAYYWNGLTLSCHVCDVPVNTPLYHSLTDIFKKLHDLESSQRSA